MRQLDEGRENLDEEGITADGDDEVEDADEAPSTGGTATGAAGKGIHNASKAKKQSADEIMTMFRRKRGGHGETTEGGTGARTTPKKRGRPPKELPVLEGVPKTGKGTPAKKKVGATKADKATPPKPKAKAHAKAKGKEKKTRPYYGDAPDKKTGLGCSKCRYYPKGCANCMRRLLLGKKKA